MAKETVERDFEEIKESGVLRMITSYSPESYLLHRGYEAGFEYELLNAFAKEHDLVLEIVFREANENPHDLLNNGSGDVIADHYTITPQRKQFVQFTHPYSIADKVLVYSDSLNLQPETIAELTESGQPVTVRRNSSAFFHIDAFRQQGMELDIRMMPDDPGLQSLLTQVANDTTKATVLDEPIANAAVKYIPGLKKGLVIASKDTVAWAVRKNSPGLESEMSRFLQQHFRPAADREEPRRTAFLNLLRQRYFAESPQIAEYYNPEEVTSGFGYVSAYDGLIKSAADSMELDWLMLTAMIVQESGFNPGAKSMAGAVGLMQVLPRFSVTEYQNLYEPEVNIREGAQIIREHLDHYAYLDSLNQWSFALATYNVGIGHMVDARRLVMDQNKNPNEWENIEDALLKLMQRRYYENARYGYCRGIETVQYVKQILNRYRMYTQVASIRGEEITGNLPDEEFR
ncbi:MAG: transporter substrate-binding domain-containing protein [Balneolaceae bacterium]